MKKTVIHSVSLYNSQSEWLKEHPEASLSFLAQQAVELYKKDFESSLAQKENKLLREHLELVKRQLGRRAIFIDKKGLNEEFFAMDERGEL